MGGQKQKDALSKAFSGFLALSHLCCVTLDKS